ncbi:hypothetical protein [Nocardioides ferulae]|uniref:hypothetical protein n=1 Tax=Nocardioides ferulae TaxID=2340821 RepID=UPI000EAEBC9A|nr:hypothetical protein [Nocardioides ferulae]
MGSRHKAPLYVFVMLAIACSFILVSDLRGSAIIGGTRAPSHPVGAALGGPAQSGGQPHATTPSPVPHVPAASTPTWAEPSVVSRERVAAAPAAPQSGPLIGVATSATVPQPGSTGSTLTPVDVVGAAEPIPTSGQEAPDAADGEEPDSQPGGPKPGSPAFGFAELWTLPPAPPAPPAGQPSPGPVTPTVPEATPTGPDDPASEDARPDPAPAPEPATP